jgi:hypothetical protein
MCNFPSDDKLTHGIARYALDGEVELGMLLEPSERSNKS